MSVITALRRAGIVNPHGLAVTCGEDRRTWARMLDGIAARAAMLRTAGVGPGQRVAMLSWNRPDYFECLMAVWWGGGVIVPLNTRLAFEEVQTIVGHSEAALFITDAAFADMGTRILDSVPAIRRHLVLGADWSLEQTSPEPFIAESGDLAAVFYTGGTTGTPKGAELTHANFLYMAMTIHRELRHDPSTVYLHVAPLFHLADFSICLGVVLGAGAHSFMQQFSVDGFFRRLDEDGVTHLALVPTMLDMVLEAPERDLRMLERIRSISYGAAPITETLLRRLIQACPNARIQQFYGMTECCGASAILPADRHVLEGPMASKLRAAGQPIPGTEIRIAGPDMRECPRGETGEILMRGPGVMRGYAKESEKSRESLVGGWLRSGDLGRLDEDGYLFVLDRLKDMIISGGENIYSAEVENALGSYPGVDGCAVIGLPDDRWGERVHAVVVRKPRYTLDERQLDKHCRSLIAGYKVPRSYDIRANPLPLSGVGKVQKHELRSEWLSRQAWNRALGGSG